MEREEVAPLLAWARLLASDPDTGLPEGVESVLSVLSGEDAALPPIDEQVRRLSSLSAAALSEVFASDSRTPVRLALAAEPRLPGRDRAALVEWAFRSGCQRRLAGPLRALPFRRAVELYSLLAERSEQTFVYARPLAEHLSDFPSRAAARLEELLVLADRSDDRILVGEVLRWARTQPSTLPLEEISRRLPPRRALDVLTFLLERDRVKLTFPRARRLVALLSACSNEHHRLDAAVSGDFFDLCPDQTTGAVEVLVSSGVPLLLRLASRAGDSVTDDQLARLVGEYESQHLDELVYLVSASPHLWELFRSRAGGLPADEQRDLLDSLFSDAVRRRLSSTASPELVNALGRLSLDLLASDRSAFWGDPATVTYLFESGVVPESWWEESAPTLDEVSELLDSAVGFYDYEEEFPEPLPAPFEGLLWQVPGVVERLGAGMFGPEMLSAEQDSFRFMLLRRLQLFLAQHLGTDTRAWEVALSLASEFDGSAVALVGTAVALS